jgi:hypothetical protein
VPGYGNEQEVLTSLLAQISALVALGCFGKIKCRYRHIYFQFHIRVFLFLFLTPLPDGTLRIGRDVFPKGRYTCFFSDRSLGNRPWPFVALKDPKCLAEGAEVAFFSGEKI